MNDSVEATIVQTLRPPLQSLAEVQDHAAAVDKLVEWTDVGVLLDEGPSAIVVVLLHDRKVLALSRFCLSVSDSAAAIRAYQRDNPTLTVRCWQGHTINAEQLVDLGAVGEIWQESQDQTDTLTADDVSGFFERIERVTKEKGRGASINKDTRNEVLLAAHGRCMFDGCGTDLTFDPTTGQRGNFAYLAHNVASAESGTRGILFLSGSLSDEPSNILLLCDTHHRLVDTVAKADYLAHRLSEMRRQFCDNATELLDGLAKPPIPAYCVSWPVHRQTISSPSALQIAQALVPIGARLDGRLNMLNDNESMLRSIEPEALWPHMPEVINRTADGILMQIHNNAYRAALFAIGLMPSLISLGAKLGNKNEITPMLRHRENGLWFWPSSKPQGEFYEIHGMQELSDDESEIVLQLALTATPTTMLETSGALGFKTVSVTAKEKCVGNGALSHPVDGYHFRQRMQELLHTLKDQHAVQRVHLLPCASNAASVFFGQAFDSYHPELLIYDYVADAAMVPRLRIYNANNACVVDIPE